MVLRWYPRGRADIRDILSPAIRPSAPRKWVSRNVARVVSDVSVLCPLGVAKSDNRCGNGTEKLLRKIAQGFRSRPMPSLAEFHEGCFAPAGRVAGDRDGGPLAAGVPSVARFDWIVSSVFWRAVRSGGPSPASTCCWSS